MPATRQGHSRRHSEAALVSKRLVVRAGPIAARVLRERGWDWRHFDVVVAASGGPKWLVLSALDQLLVEKLRPRSEKAPLHLLGSSSGAWRFCAYCLPQPHQALQRLEQHYIEANWDHSQSMTERTATSRGILHGFLGPEDQHVFTQPDFRLHAVTALCKGPLASEFPLLQLGGLLLAGLLTALHRRAMGPVVERALFSDPRNSLPSLLDDAPGRSWPLRPDNLEPVLLASGAIPMVLRGVRNVPGGPRGCLRDGGLVDYHFDHVRLDCEGLILYPHFSPRLMPSWLDRYHPRPPVNPSVTARTVLVHPHPEWLQRLPGGKLPDRTDATRFSQRERRWRWHEAARRSWELAENLDAELAAAPLHPL